MHRRLYTALGIGALALAACHRGDDGTPGAVELEPRIASAAPLELEARTYVELHAPEGVHPWRVEAQRVERGPLPGLEPGALPDALLVWGQDAKRVTIPGPFDPARFDQALLTIVSRAHAAVRVELVRGGRAVLGSGWISVEDSAEPQRITARFARNALEREPYDELAIDLPPGPAALAGVELVKKPFVAWVIDEDDAPRLRAIGTEYRRALGLGGSVAREARFHAFEGARLELSYGLAPDLRLPGVAPVLEVTLSPDGAEPRALKLPLERRGDEASRWHSARIPLDGFAGRDVMLRLELAGGAAGEAYGYVGELRVARDVERAPTVLFVTSDTHRADHLGAASESAGVDTPALDALAARGVLFERAHSSTNITLPSHAALLTGLHPRDTRVVDNATPLAEEARTLAEVFRARGWRTFAAVSAGHLGPERSGLGQGFERVSVPRTSLRGATETLADVERWLADASGEPLFVWVHLFDAHTPYEPPSELEERYLARPLELATDGPELAPLTNELRRERARYKGEVSFLDRELGKLFALPRFERAVIALTADHGECLGQHEVYYDHATLYPDSVRVPLVLAWPGAPAGTRVALPSEHLGIARTLLDLAGIEDERFPGASLLDALESDARAEPVYALSYAGESASILLDDALLILHLKAHRVDKGGRVVERAEHELELYELRSDPACTRELSRERSEDTRRLRRALVAWLSSADSAGLAAPPSADPEFQAELEALGYVGSSAGAIGPWIDPACECERCQPFR